MHASKFILAGSENVEHGQMNKIYKAQVHPRIFPYLGPPAPRGGAMAVGFGGQGERALSGVEPIKKKSAVKRT